MIMTTIVTWIVTVMVTVVVCSICSINSLSWVSFEHFKAIRWVDFPISQIVQNTCHRVLGISTCVCIYIYIRIYIYCLVQNSHALFSSESNEGLL